MIAKITRGSRTAGLVSYLVGAGRANEHADPHLVAGSSFLEAWYGDDILDPRAARDIAHDLDVPRRMSGTEVRQVVRDGDGNVVGKRDATVWHCSLSLGAADGVRSDTEWYAIAHDFVEAMGFGGEDPCRWAAIRHGISGNGNDHIHIVVPLVRESGARADTWNDRRRAYEACGAIEAKYKLAPLPSRDAGRAGARGYTFAELERAGADGGRHTARRILGRVVRASAHASRDEGEFVRRLRREGIRVRPRFATGTTDVVAGYSVALPPPDGKAPVWFGGNTLDRDLGLPRLRELWPDTTPQSATEAVDEWTAARRGTRTGVVGAETATPSGRGEDLLADHARRLQQVRERINEIPVDDRAGWAHLARSLSGSFAAWSLRLEETPGPLADAADGLAHVGQLRRHQERPRPGPLADASGTAAVILMVAAGGKGRAADIAMLRQMWSLTKTLHDMMKARGEAAAAAAYRDHVHGALEKVRAAYTTGAPTSTTPSSGTSAPGVTPREPGSPLPPVTPRPPTPDELRRSPARAPSTRGPSTPER